MSAKPLNESLSFLSPLFLLLFQLIKEREMDTKELIRGDMKMGEGVRESPGQMRGEEQRSLTEVAEREQPAPDGGLRTSPLWDFKSRRPISRSAYLGSHPVLRSPSYRLNPSGFSEGAAVDDVLPPSGLVADMVVGVCLESVHYHECQHACFNQEPSSIPNTALLNGKTFQHFNHCCLLIFSAAWLTLNAMFWLNVLGNIFQAPFGNL